MLIIPIVLISLIETFFKKGFLLSVVLILIPFTIMWTEIIGVTRNYWAIAIAYWKERTKGLDNYFYMFLSAGLFVEMLSVSGILTVLEPMFTRASENVILLYLMIAGYFLVTSLVGFHPLISLTFLAGLLQPVLPQVDPIPLNIVLISCSLAPIMYSPYNLSISILADQLKINPYRIGRWNICFAIFYMSLSISVAYFLGIILR